MTYPDELPTTQQYLKILSRNVKVQIQESLPPLFYVFISLSFQVTLFLNIVKIKEYKNTITKKANGIG